MSTDRPYDLHLTAASIVLSLVGIVTNTMSLSYFMRRRNKGLGNTLLMLLSSCDLSVCSIYVLTAILAQIYPKVDDSDGARISYLVCWFIYKVVFDCTGFSTCLLSVTRTIKVCRPFLSIKEVWIGASFLLYLLCSFGREFMCDYVLYIKPIENPTAFTNYAPLLFSLGVTFNVVAVFISSMITVYRLLRKNTVKGINTENSRHATVTILILSTIFCFLNSIFISLCLVAFCYNMGIFKIDSIEKTAWSYSYIVWSMIICLNSTLNPMVYLTRKEDMRLHLAEMWTFLVEKLTTES